MRKKTIIIILAVSLPLFVWEHKKPIPTYAKHYTKLAQIEIEKNNPKAAISDLHLALINDPHFSPALHMLGKIHLADKDTLSLEYFLEEIFLGPDYQKIYLDLKSSDAIRDDAYAEACLEVGLWHLKNNHADLAIKYLKRSDLFLYRQAKTYHSLGLAYLQMGDIPAAIKESYRLDFIKSSPLRDDIRNRIPDFSKYKSLMNQDFQN